MKLSVDEEHYGHCGRCNTTQPLDDVQQGSLSPGVRVGSCRACGATHVMALAAPSGTDRANIEQQQRRK